MNDIQQNNDLFIGLLYEKWFVNFDFPDADGNPYQSSGGAMIDVDGELIPEGWERTTLGEVSVIRTGKKDVNEGNPEGKFPFFTCAKESTFSDSFSFDCDAMVLAGNGDFHLGLVSGKFEAYQRVYVIESPVNNLDFMFHQMKRTIGQITSQSSGSIIKYLTIGMLTNHPLTLPPLVLQARFAEIVGPLREQVVLSNRIQEQKALYAELTYEKWFVNFDFPDADGNPYQSSGGTMIDVDGELIPEGWERVTLESISTRVTSGTTPKGLSKMTVKAGGGVNFLKVESFDWSGTFIPSKISQFPHEVNDKMVRSQLSDGDILLTMAGTLGRIAVVNDSVLPGNINQAISAITPDATKVSTSYLVEFLRSDTLKSFIQQKQVVSAQANLNLTDIRKMPVPLPPLVLQEAFAKVVS